MLIVLAGWAALSVVLLFATVDPHLDGAGILAGGADLYVYREGAWRTLHGLPLYTERFVLDLLYTYPPFSTLAFIPVERIPGVYVDQVWMIVNLGTLYACVLASWRMLGYRLTASVWAVSALLAAMCLFLEPVRTTLFYGQINLVLMLLVLFDFTRRERGPLRGIGIGIAAGIKLTPAYFVAVFVALRQWRSAVTAVAVFTATVLCAWIVVPDSSFRYWTTTFFESTRIAEDTHPSNQSLRGVVAHLTGAATPLWLWLLLAGLATAVSLVVTVRLYRNGEKLLAVTLSGLTAAAVSPFSWSHHWVWFVPLTVYLVHRSFTRPRWWVAVVLLWVAAGAWPYHWSETSVVIGLFLFPPEWPVMPILTNIYALVFVVVLVGAARRAFGRRPPRSPEAARDEDGGDDEGSTDGEAGLTAAAV
nr:glycosyltransferase 87 family protein [Rhodococcus sp. HNM0569]